MVFGSNWTQVGPKFFGVTIKVACCPLARAVTKPRLAVSFVGSIADLDACFPARRTHGPCVMKLCHECGIFGAR
jgi:hypothetical protein